MSTSTMHLEDLRYRWQRRHVFLIMSTVFVVLVPFAFVGEAGRNGIVSAVREIGDTVREYIAIFRREWYR